MAAADASVYKLRCEVQGHEGDVRSVVPLPGGGLVSGSRDRSVRLWTPGGDGSFVCTQTLFGHEDWITQVEALPDGRIVSSARDGSIIVWEGDNPVGVLSGHTGNACALKAASDGRTIVSGSWDKTARVWDVGTSTCTATLTGHAEAVWAVLPLDDGGVLTASADKTIKLWRDGACVHTYTGHTDCVRALAALPGVGFMSAANDGSVRVWALSGETLQVTQAHDNYVYALRVAASGEFLTAGEDKTAKVWLGDTCVATLPHPGSVWTVAAMADGDFVTGCADGVIRVFTKDPSRYASPDALAAYEATIASQSVPAASLPAGVTVEEPEALLVPGNRDGETKIVRAGQGADAYLWSSAEGKWNKIGSVTDKAGEGGRTMLYGKEYDHVIDVKLSDDTPALKLGFNNGDNEYSVAQEFIWANDIDQDHLQEIAEYVANVTRPKTIEAVPAHGSAYAAGGAAGGFGGAAARPTGPPSGAGISPFHPQYGKGEGAHVPKEAYLTFDTSKPAAVEDKAAQVNDALRADAATAGLALSDDEVAVMRECMKSSLDFKALYGAKHVAVWAKMLAWPTASVFPALDMMRLLVLNPTAAGKVAKCTEWAGAEDVIARTVAVAGGDASVPMPTRMMALRLCANAFKHVTMRPVIARRAVEALDAMGNSMQYDNAQVRLAYVTLLYNVAIAMRGTADVDVKTVALGAILEALDTPLDAESTYRLVCALGTIATPDVVATTKELGGAVRLRALQPPATSDPRVVGAVQQVLALLA